MTSVRVFFLRQKRNIKFVLTFLVLIAIIAVLYTLTQDPVTSSAPPLQEKLEELRKSNVLVYPDKSKEKISKKTFESADRQEWRDDVKEEKPKPTLPPVKKIKTTTAPTTKRRTTTTTTTTTTPERPKTTAAPPAVPKIQLIKKYPDAIIIGVHKCNTRLLFDILHEHPQVSTTVGVDFFNDNVNFKKGDDWYWDHLPDIPKGNKLLERASTYYCSSTAAQRLHEMFPKTKLIFMACDPVKRAIGHYRDKKIDDESLDPFENLAIHPLKNDINEEHDFIVNSIYNMHLRTWLKYFPKDQIFFLDDFSLAHDTDSVLRSMESFLGVSHKVSNNQIYYNETRGTRCGSFEEGVVCFGMDRRLRKPRPQVEIDPKVVEKLKNYFRGHNQEFYKAVGKQFQW